MIGCLNNLVLGPRVEDKTGPRSAPFTGEDEGMHRHYKYISVVLFLQKSLLYLMRTTIMNRNDWTRNTSSG